MTEPGAWEPRGVAPGADVRMDLPRYRVYQRGVLVEEPSDVVRWWRDDLVAFLLGCSLSFEAAMQRAGLPVRHLEAGCNVPMYRTNCRAHLTERSGAVGRHDATAHSPQGLGAVTVALPQHKRADSFGDTRPSGFQI